jgi:hypothetical protein
MEFDMWIEFDESEIPAGMDAWEYAHHLAVMGEWSEYENAGDFRIYDVQLLDEDAYNDDDGNTN